MHKEYGICIIPALDSLKLEGLSSAKLREWKRV